MDNPIPQTGSEPTEPAPLVVTLILRPTPHGYAMEVQHTPGLFPDTVIDVCHRAARFYERVALLQEMQAAAVQQSQAQRNAIDIRRRLS